jgi:hypothetical protein
MQTITTRSYCAIDATGLLKAEAQPEVRRLTGQAWAVGFARHLKAKFNGDGRMRTYI